MRFVIASNEVSLTETLCKALSQSSYGCKLLHTCTVEAAPDLLQDHHLRLDVLIIVLPVPLQNFRQIIRDVGDRTDAWVVVASKLGSTSDLVDLLQHGVNGFVDVDREIGPQLEATLENKKRHKIDQEELASQLVAVGSASGGAGSSTLAVNLATTYALRRGGCGLLDFDLEKGDQAHLLNLKPRHSVEDLCRTPTLVDQSMLQQSMIRHENGVQLLAAAQGIRDTTTPEISKLQRILEISAISFPTSFVDFGGPASFQQRWELLRSCTQLVLVLKLDFTGLCNARRILDLLEHEQFDLNQVTLVANRSGLPGEIPIQKARTILDREIDVNIPHDESTSNLSVNCGVPVVMESPQKSMAIAIRTLTESILPDCREAAPSDKKTMLTGRAIAEGLKLIKASVFRGSAVLVTDAN